MKELTFPRIQGEGVGAEGRAVGRRVKEARWQQAGVTNRERDPCVHLNRLCEDKMCQQPRASEWSADSRAVTLDMDCTYPPTSYLTGVTKQ